MNIRQSEINLRFRHKKRIREIIPTFQIPNSAKHRRSSAALMCHRHVIHYRSPSSPVSFSMKKQQPFRIAVWCERRDLNPYGKSTRPSNVRVCQFRHSREDVCNYSRFPAICQAFFQKKIHFYFYINRSSAPREPPFPRSVRAFPYEADRSRSLFLQGVRRPRR